MSGQMDRGRHGDKMGAGKRYNSRSPAPVDTGVARASSTHSHPSRSPSTHSTSNSPRTGDSSTRVAHPQRHRSTSGVHSGRKGYSDSPSTPDSGLPPPSKSPSGHLSPVLRDSRSVSRGRSDSDTSHRSGSLTGRKGYNEEQGTRQSRSSSSASGPSSAHRATETGPDYSPRTHAGMSGRKGYNQENPGAVAEAPENIGLGLSAEHSPRRHDGLSGRKGYNKTPSPRR